MDVNCLPSIIITLLSTLVVIPLIGIMLFVIRKLRPTQQEHQPEEQQLGSVISLFEPKKLDAFSLSDTQIATDNFSENNVLGEGSHAVVYKGILLGRNVAVKRDKSTSSQGYVAELTLMSEFNHKNLLEVQGFCFQESERLIVYEFCPNDNLKHFLNDVHMRSVVTWPQRLGIVSGIAAELKYLHSSSRKPVLHRDIKPGNILFDADWNPKLADFGTALYAASDFTAIKHAGTLGYADPTCILESRTSICDKLDIYSFGVVMLEIISGRENSVDLGNGSSMHISVLAWRIWQESSNKTCFLRDGVDLDSYNEDEFLRVYNVALLCVQTNMKDSQQRRISYQ